MTPVEVGHRHQNHPLRTGDAEILGPEIANLVEMDVDRGYFPEEFPESVLAQVAGGLAIITGVLFRVGALCVAIVMLGAIFMVHLPHGFDVSKGGFEYALTLFLIAIAFLFTGPGAYSLNPSLPEPLRKL